MTTIEYTPTYRRVVILDKHQYILREGTYLPRFSMEVVLRNDLVFAQLESGGLIVLKDIHNQYGKNNIFFAV